MYNLSKRHSKKIGQQMKTVTGQTQATTSVMSLEH